MHVYPLLREHRLLLFAGKYKSKSAIFPTIVLTA